MTNLWVMRHCESAGNTDVDLYTTQPNTDIPLSPDGEEHAVQAAKSLIQSIWSAVESESLHLPIASYRPIIMVSPFTRAIQTADILSQELQKIYLGPQDVIEDILLSEQNYGCATGCSKASEYAKGQKTSLAYKLPSEESFYNVQTKLYYQFPQGESPAQVAYRAETILNKIKQFTVINVIIVAHKNFCCMLEQQMLQQYKQQYDWGNGEFRRYRTFDRYGLQTFIPF